MAGHTGREDALATTSPTRRARCPGNVDKTKAAPVTAIIGYDTRFYELLPKLFPHRPEMKNPYEANARLAETVAFRNGTLQGAYFMIAARAVGLDVGGMSGFDNAKVDAEFFPDDRIKSNFLCNIGHGDPAKILSKLPRLSFASPGRLGSIRSRLVRRSHGGNGSLRPLRHRAAHAARAGLSASR